MRTATQAFVFAESLCSGSTLDNYATCILNNMRFMPYTKDTAVSLVTGTAGIVSNVDIPAIAGKTFVELKPVAISDIRARMLQKNDSGQVRFRCLDVFSQPLLPLTNLQDLGLEDKGLVGEDGSFITVSNAIDLDTTIDIACNDGYSYFTGVPIICMTSASTDELKYYRMAYNIRSHLIYLNNLLNELDTDLMAIVSIIDNNGNYNNLLGIYNNLMSKLSQVEDLKDIIGSLVVVFNSLYTTDPYLKGLFTLFNNFSVPDLSSIEPIATYIHVDEDWTHFQHYNEILQVSTDILSLVTTASYLGSFYNVSTLVSLSRIMPTDFIYSNSTQMTDFKTNLAIKYASEFYNAINTLFNKIQSYSIGALALDITVEKAKFRPFVELYNFGFVDLFSNTEQVLIKVVDVVNTGVSNLDDYFNFQPLPTLEQLNSFYSTKGNNTIIKYNELYSSINSTLGITTSELTEIDLGASFKDSGKYYFANVAYVVGFGTLSNIHQIQIDDNIYDTTSIVKDDGSVINQVSQDGCTKYRFKQKLFTGVENNANTKEVEMYIYPGTPTQPFCPTINKFHNMAVCSYTGLFTKLLEQPDGSIESALFLYKGYEPMKGVVKELIKLGSTDINSIDLSLPNIDLNSTESFINRQIVALNTSSTLLLDNTITSKDFRYYLKASLNGTVIPIEATSPIQHQGLSVDNAINYPNLAIIEFIGLPLGSNLKVPNITILTTAVDSIL